MVKLETIAVNILGHSLTITGSSGIIKEEFEKKDFGQNLMKYIEDYITKNGFDITNAETAGNIRLYHLIKK
ncbi:MAG: hypothetical protein ACFFBP_15130 [Promethearchaeota archaeon]